MSGTFVKRCTGSRIAILALMPLALAACASGGEPRPGPRVCNDDMLGWAVGAPLDQANYARLLRESGARLLDPLGPDSRVRRDARTDRLRVYVDRDNRITAARCE